MLLCHYMVEIGSTLPPSIFLLVHVQFFATGLLSPLSRERVTAETWLRSYTVIARRKRRLNRLHERELPTAQYVEKENVETHQLSQTGQGISPSFDERVDGQSGQRPESSGWDDPQVLFKNFDGRPALQSSFDVLLDQSICSHQPDNHKRQSVFADMEMVSTDLKEVTNVSSSE